MVSLVHEKMRRGRGREPERALTRRLQALLAVSLSTSLFMFKRPFTSKTSAPLRSSDLRKLRDELSTLFAIPAALAKGLLPDGLLTCKSLSHLDEHLTIYSAPNADPRFFRPGKGNDGALIPTAYAFDLVPDLLPTLVTAHQVVEHLVSGAGELSFEGKADADWGS